jgi:hypothetical protein
MLWSNPLQYKTIYLRMGTDNLPVSSVYRLKQIIFPSEIKCLRTTRRNTVYVMKYAYKIQPTFICTTTSLEMIWEGCRRKWVLSLLHSTTGQTWNLRPRTGHLDYIFSACSGTVLLRYVPQTGCGYSLFTSFHFTIHSLQLFWRYSAISIQELNTIILQLVSIYLCICPPIHLINPIHSRYDSLDGGSVRRKTVTYTQNNTNTE